MSALAELYAAVYASPDDDAPRSVLADALQEVGDPRGELIALQLARGRGGTRSRRERELLKAHARAWLGPIGLAITNSGLGFERGFVARCQLQHHRESVEPYLGHPAWATVEEVELGRWRESLQPLLAALPSLRSLGAEGHVGQLASHPRLERLRTGYIYDHTVAHLASLALPALRELTVEWCYATLPELRPFLDGTPSLRRLALSVPDLPAWIDWLAERGYEHATVRETMRPWVLTIEPGRLAVRFVDGGHPQPRAGEQLAELVDMVPTASWDVTVTCTAQPLGTTVQDIQAASARALGRFTSCDVVIA